MGAPGHKSSIRPSQWRDPNMSGLIWMLQGEFEEARSIMKKMGAENKLMHSILAQGRNMVGKLQEAIPSGEGTSTKVN